MAKKTTKKAKAGFNKSKAIRDYLGANPGASNQEVAGALSKFGVTTNYVGTIKVNMKNKGKKTVAVKKKAVAGKKTTVKRKTPAKKKAAVKRKVATKKQQVANDLISISAMREAKALVAKLGGVKQAQEAINAWASLSE